MFYKFITKLEILFRINVFSVYWILLVFLLDYMFFRSKVLQIKCLKKQEINRNVEYSEKF